MIYVISDLHGYPQQDLRKLLAGAGFSDEDFLYILGDVIDRHGDGGVETLLWLLEQPNAQLILGNHEAMLLSCRFALEEVTDEALAELTVEHLGTLDNYMFNGGDVTLRALRKLPLERVRDIFSYLTEAPLYEGVSVGDTDYLLVHAGLQGFRPDKKLSAYAPDELMWQGPAMDEDYFEDIVTVFGHTPTFVYGEAFRGRVLTKRTWIDIDAGAGYGEEPVLFRLDDRREFRLSEL